MDTRVERLYRLLGDLPICGADTPSAALPANGVYFFFERGETIELGGKRVLRVVRIGTHREDGRFRERIRQHYGNRGSLGGNKNGSVFRKHVGGALLMRGDPEDPRLPEWIKQGGRSFPEVEEAVSINLRQNFVFVWIEAPDREARLGLESGLIALLAQRPAGRPSRGWLGHFAVDRGIRASGLWNTQNLGSEPLTMDQLTHLEDLVWRQGVQA